MILIKKLVEVPAAAKVTGPTAAGTRSPLRLNSYVGGRWEQVHSDVSVLLNPATGDPMAEVATAGPGASYAYSHALTVGGAKLRALSFAERGGLLRSLAGVMEEHRNLLLHLSMENGGNTKSDAFFDIDGAIFTLNYYAQLAEEITARHGLILDGSEVVIRDPIGAQHVYSSRRGVAVHIGAFNFPAWGMCEKLACAILAGVPVISKPATATALVAHRIVKLWVDAEVLPEGAFQLVLGSGSAMNAFFDQLHSQSVVAFTGSGETATAIATHPRLVERRVRLNLELDSLNAAVLAPDVTPGSNLYNRFLDDVVHEMTQKAGGKCTATRRIFVPDSLLGQVQTDLIARLGQVKVGNPADASVTMGPLATQAQLDAARNGLRTLLGESELVFGAADGAMTDPIGVPAGKTGFFFGPVLLVNRSPLSAEEIHRREVFGPVATLMPYDGAASTAAQLIGLGGGALVGSSYSNDAAFQRGLIVESAAYQGRIVVVSDTKGKLPRPGNVLPQLVHGGPGAAGDGLELGGLRGVMRYMNLTALEGDRVMIGAILGEPDTAPAA